MIVSSRCLHIFAASSIGRVGVVESNEGLSIRRPENQRVTYAVETLVRYFDDALGDQVDVFAGLRVEAVGTLILFKDIANDDGAVRARVDLRFPVISLASE
jgi:hypothetical protein